MTFREARNLVETEYRCVETDACSHECDTCLRAGKRERIMAALELCMRLMDWCSAVLKEADAWDDDKK
ncbi:MAG: hypothetical protein IKF59_04405 [Lachnospiraceae bacterium]|nr:hypothetical protein [Eubacterium sp.]MBR3187264.1 hypothetical protein [Lachnospiraceae bacterium]